MKAQGGHMPAPDTFKGTSSPIQGGSGTVGAIHLNHSVQNVKIS